MRFSNVFLGAWFLQRFLFCSEQEEQEDEHDEEVEEVIQACEVATFKRGEHIIHQGEESSDIAIILDGCADVFIKDQFGKMKVITQLVKGDLFGELVLINETKRTADIVAKEETNILIISYENFYSFYTENL